MSATNEGEVEYLITDPNLLFLLETECCSGKELCDKLVAIGAIRVAHPLKISIRSLSVSFDVKLDPDENDVLTLKRKILATTGTAINRQHLVRESSTLPAAGQPNSQANLENSDHIEESCSLVLYVRAPPKHPIHPKDAFTLFANATRPVVRKQQPSLPWKELSKEITSQYESLPLAERSRFSTLAEEEIGRWECELDDYDPEWRIKRDLRKQQEEQDRASRGDAPFKFNFKMYCC